MSEVKFEFSNDAISFISGLEAKQVKQIWARVIALKRDPRPAYSEHLSGYPGYFRITIGEFRCVYEFDHDTINIRIVERRNDDKVYQKLRRVG